MQVDVGLKQLSCHFMGGATGAQHGLEAFAEANALQLKAQKPVRVQRFRRQRQKHVTEAHTLYTLELTTGTLQVRKTQFPHSSMSTQSSPSLPVSTLSWCDSSMSADYDIFLV